MGVQLWTLLLLLDLLRDLLIRAPVMLVESTSTGLSASDLFRYTLSAEVAVGMLVRPLPYLIACTHRGQPGVCPNVLMFSCRI